MHCQMQMGIVQFKCYLADQKPTRSFLPSSPFPLPPQEFLLGKQRVYNDRRPNRLPNSIFQPPTNLFIIYAFFSPLRF